MKHREPLWVVTILGVIIAFFFYQTIFLGKVPFPGDILVSDFQPWRSTSYLGYGAGGIPNKAQYPDTIRQMYPWKTLAVESLKQGKLPLWNPYNFSGTPLLANFQTAALYPISVIYLFMSQINAWTVLVILQPLLAALFTYLYSRKVGMKAAGSTLAALSYGFSGFMAVWLEYNTVGQVILWLPCILLASEHLKEKPRAVWLGILAFTHASALLAGHPQVYAYTMMFSLLYAGFRVQKKMWGYIAGFTGLGIGIAGLQIVPGIELIMNAARSPHEFSNLFTKILISPMQLLSLPFPNFFGNPATRTYWPEDTFVGKVTTIGLVPLFFSFSAFRRKDALTKLFIRSSIVLLLLITSNPLTAILYRIPIPLITSSSPTLMAFLFAFSLAVTCGLGLDYWMTDSHSVKKLIRRTLEVGGVFVLLILATKLPLIPQLSGHAPVALRALVYGAMVSAATLGIFWVAIRLPKLRAPAIALLLIVHALDLFIFFNRFNPFVPVALVFPQHTILSYLRDKAPDRYWGYGTAGIPANFGAEYHIFSPEGYDPLYPKWYGEFLYGYRSGKPMEVFTNSTRSDAAISSTFGDGGLSDLNKQKILSALSVRYVLDRTENAGSEQTYPPAVVTPIHSFEEWRIFENLTASPRAYFADQIMIYKNAVEFGQIFFSPKTNMSHTALLTEEVTGVPRNTLGGSAKILSYEPERLSIGTERDMAGLLVLTDTYYPGWQAVIDGNPTPIIRTNWTMRGVVVPAGNHTVTMTYAPKNSYYGAILSMISIGMTIIGLVIVSRKHA